MPRRIAEPFIRQVSCHDGQAAADALLQPQQLPAHQRRVLCQSSACCMSDRQLHAGHQFDVRPRSIAQSALF